MNDMESELAFVRERRRILRGVLKKPEADIDRVQRIQRQMELRLLDRVTVEVTEGKALRTLQSWRQHLGQQLAAYKQATRREQNIADDWYRSSVEEKEQTSKPQSPSLGIRITASNNQQFIIDDRYLEMMDNLIVRLQKWLEN
ncbi:MAG: hypothetical protein GY805_34780 [Chloroflexi bacterium]|nr:hypothetical protein [Chloroflexota bacterium]